MNENFNPSKTGVFARPNLEKQLSKFKKGDVIYFKDKDAKIIIEEAGNDKKYAVRVEFADETAQDYVATETGIIQAQNNIANLSDKDNWELVGDAGPKES